ncbi:hypothetical protein IAT38_006628 [Cryptococcus sp. DSM 104549]
MPTDQASASDTTATTQPLPADSPSAQVAPSSNPPSTTVPSSSPPIAQTTPAVAITSPSPTTSPNQPSSTILQPPIELPSSSKLISTTEPAKDMSVEKGTLPTDSETAVIAGGKGDAAPKAADGEASKSTSLNNLTRKLSGKAPATTAATSAPAAGSSSEKPVDSTPAPAQTSSASTPAPKPTTTSTTTSTTPRATPAAASASAAKPTPRNTHKKKRKRKGLAGLLLALGCLSADEFEDEKSASGTAAAPSSKTGAAPVKADGTAKAGEASAKANGTKPNGEVPSGAATQPVKGEETVGSGHKADATGTTGTTLVGEGSSEERGVKKEEVIVPPTEPHTLPEDETAGVTSSAVQAPGGGSSLLSTPSRPHPVRRESDTNAGTSSATAEAERTETSGGYSDISNSELVDESSGQGGEEGLDEYGMEDDYDDEEDRLIEQGGMGIPLDENGNPQPLLPPLAKRHYGRKCLVLDLDETLLHSSFKSLSTADYIVPVEIESQIHNVYVIKRPGVDHFLTEMAKYYEIVVFTASLSKYADPVLDMLDPNRVVEHRLFRESCYNHKGNYVKDLSQLGRDIETSIIIDNSPASYIFHPNNAVPVSTWFSDPHDSELTDLCPFLIDLSTVDDVRGVLDGRLF